jgi:hypothetical protein
MQLSVTESIQLKWYSGGILVSRIQDAFGNLQVEWNTDLSLYENAFLTIS